MKNFSLEKKLILLVLAVLVVAIVVTTSYAWFTATVSGNPTNSNVVTSGKMEVTYVEGNNINTTNNMLPGQSVTKTFSISNTGDVATVYDIYLNDVVNTFTNKNELVYTLTSTGGGTTINQTVAPSVNTKIASNVALAKNATHTYTLTITFLETSANQDDNKGASFSARVGLVEAAVSSPYVYATMYSGTNGVITQKSEGEITRPLRVYPPYYDEGYEIANYLRYDLVNDEIDINGIPKTCGYREGYGELCLLNNEYLTSRTNILNYVGFNEDTWTHSVSESDSDRWDNNSSDVQKTCWLYSGALNCNMDFYLNNNFQITLYFSADASGNVSSMSVGNVTQICQIDSDNSYNCHMSS